MNTGDRGAGRTTKQIKEAPQGAVFICPASSAARDYTKRLAHHLGRDDLRFEGIDYLDRRWQGLRLPVVIDHAAPEFFRRVHWDGYAQLRQYNSSHNIPFS